MSPAFKYLCIQIQQWWDGWHNWTRPIWLARPLGEELSAEIVSTLETDYAFLRVTYRSLANPMLDYFNEIFGEKLHEGQIVFQAASASEPTGKRISDIESAPVHLAFHDRNDMKVLTEEGTQVGKSKKVVRMANEAFWIEAVFDTRGSGSASLQIKKNDQARNQRVERTGNRSSYRETLQDIGPGVTLHINRRLSRCGWRDMSVSISNVKRVTPASRFRDIFRVSRRQSDFSVSAAPCRKCAS